MLELSLLLSVISSLISISASSESVFKMLKRVDRMYKDFDYFIELQDGTKMIIEVMANPPTKEKLKQLFTTISKIHNVSNMIIVTPDAPSIEQEEIFKDLLDFSETSVSWIGINDLPEMLGIKKLGDLRTDEGLANLQKAVLLLNQEKYSESPIGVEFEGIYGKEPIELIEDIPYNYRGLKRQFSYLFLAQLSKRRDDIERLLGFGNPQKNVTVVLSDIKNFSSLVKASRPDDLKELMSKYYVRARELVWEHDGMLDKFIGDAVLAVFGYPFQDNSSTIKAIKFSLDLVSYGKEILENYIRRINEIIVTGTRVGITTGDIWPLNIGHDEIELSFVGDTINLAARLEKNCEANGILISNITRTNAMDVDGNFIDMLNIVEKVLNPYEVKGSELPIKAWQIPSID